MQNVMVALLDPTDMAPLAVSTTPEFIQAVASRLAADMVLPPVRSARYSIERARWALLRSIAGEDPGAAPGAFSPNDGDELIVYEFLFDPATTESALPKEGI